MEFSYLTRPDLEELSLNMWLCMRSFRITNKPRLISIFEGSNVMNQFLKHAKGLAKNPLGIIALFISLIYGFASLVLGLSSSNLAPSERIILIWFIVLFPILILITFVFLVIKHHQKLYSPSDFRDDESFLRTFSPEKKFQEEYRQHLDDAGNSDEAQSTKETKKKSTKEKSNRSEALSYEDFQNTYILAENLALGHYERKYDQKINKHVVLRGFPEEIFDGVIENEDRIIGIEIKYIPTLTISDSTLKAITNRIQKFKYFVNARGGEKPITYIIAFVRICSFPGTKNSETSADGH